MSRISNKVLIGLAGGAAALSLVGVGAGATFTDFASAAGSYSTAHAAVTLTNTYGKITADHGSFNPQQWSWLAQQTTEGSNGSKGFTLTEADNGGGDSPVSNPLGSDTTSVANFDILKTPGSAQLNALSLTASVANPGANRALIGQSSISIVMRNPGSGIGDQSVYNGTLDAFLTAASGAGYNVVANLSGGSTAAPASGTAAYDFLAQINGYQGGGSGGTDPGALFTMTISPTSSTGYTNAAQDETMALTVNANVAG